MYYHLIVLFRVPSTFFSISSKAFTRLDFDFESFITTLGKFDDKESCFKKVTRLYICGNECG